MCIAGPLCFIMGHDSTDIRPSNDRQHIHVVFECAARASRLRTFADERKRYEKLESCDAVIHIA